LTLISIQKFSPCCAWSTITATFPPQPLLMHLKKKGVTLPCSAEQMYLCPMLPRRNTAGIIFYTPENPVLMNQERNVSPVRP